MSIDAIIQYVNVKSDEITLVLAPRWDARNRSWSIPGKPKLRIREYTRIPKEGQAVWGGSDTVHIVVGKDQEWLYRRMMDGTLREYERSADSSGAR